MVSALVLAVMCTAGMSRPSTDFPMEGTNFTRSGLFMDSSLYQFTMSSYSCCKNNVLILHSSIYMWQGMTIIVFTLQSYDSDCNVSSICYAYGLVYSLHRKHGT